MSSSSSSSNSKRERRRSSRSPGPGSSYLRDEELPAPSLQTAQQLCLTEQERGWVLKLQDELRQQQQQQQTILSDLEVAAHALVSKGESSKAVQRIRRLQAFQETYKISPHTTIYQAMKILLDFRHAYPDAVVSGGRDGAGRSVCMVRLQALWNEQAGMTTRPKLSISERFVALYYLLQALQPDLEAIRQGTVWVVDLEGFSRQHVPLEVWQGARALFRDAYPIKVKDVPCLQSPSVFSAVYLWCRPLLSSKFLERMVPSVDLLTLRRHFSQKLRPKSLGGVQTSTEWTDWLEASLKRRFDMQESFRLNLLGIPR